MPMASNNKQQDAAQRDAQNAAAAKAKVDAAIKEAEQRTVDATAALEAECNKRVPSQSTENLEALHKQCLVDNAALFGLTPPAQ